MKCMSLLRLVQAFQSFYFPKYIPRIPIDLGNTARITGSWLVFGDFNKVTNASEN